MDGGAAPLAEYRPAKRPLPPLPRSLPSQAARPAGNTLRRGGKRLLLFESNTTPARYLAVSVPQTILRLMRFTRLRLKQGLRMRGSGKKTEAEVAAITQTERPLYRFCES